MLDFTCFGGSVGFLRDVLEGSLPGPPNGPLMEPLWPLIVGIWGIIEGSWGSR